MRRSVQVTLGCVVALGLAACNSGAEASALGETIDVGYTDASTNTSTSLAVTVLGVREGTVAELEESGLQFDPEERENVPYYVDARYENTGDEAVERSMRPSLEDPDGNLINPTVIFDFAGEGGAGGPCPHADEGELGPGESFEDCTLFLVPQGVTVDRVTFLSQPPGEEPEFVYWKVE